MYIQQWTNFMNYYFMSSHNFRDRFLFQNHYISMGIISIWTSWRKSAGEPKNLKTRYNKHNRITEIQGPETWQF